MLKYIFIIVIFVLFIRFRKVKIKWKSLFKKGVPIEVENFGIYCYCGKQGSCKTFSAVQFLIDNQDLEIYSNVHLNCLKYTYISDYKELLKLKNKKNCIIFYDEIFTIISKSHKLEKDFMSFLSQMRKNRQIFITTAQEWLEINVTFRRYCKYQIDCKKLVFFGKGYVMKSFYDADQMKWSQEDNEYIAPLIMTTIEKMSLEVAKTYDTLEQIETS